jgi:hypothetical protein
MVLSGMARRYCPRLSRRTQAGSGSATGSPRILEEQAPAMPNSVSTTAKNTTAFAAQAAISFGASLFAMLVAVYFMDADPWIKGFLALGTLYLTTSTFTLAKVVRDMQDDSTVMHRLDQARLDKALAQHDPYRSA